MATYYNEFDKNAAAWLRELIKRNLIPDGEVDERSIVDVQPEDLAFFEQCHFFAGIGGWPLALRMVGWPDDRPVWTGSCPCQPFSEVGARRGFRDERHLWPEFARLIAECEPSVVFGEQVASTDGRVWLAGVRTDLEVFGYSVGAADLCAAGVGAPHIRQRLYWVGHSDRARLERHDRHVESTVGAHAQRPGATQRRFGDWDRYEILACEDGRRRVQPGELALAHGVPARVVRLRGYGNAVVPTVAAEFISAYLDVANEDLLAV